MGVVSLLLLLSLSLVVAQSLLSSDIQQQGQQQQQQPQLQQQQPWQQQQQQQQYPQQQPQPQSPSHPHSSPFSPPSRSDLNSLPHSAHLKSHQVQQLLSSEIQLTCPSASACGVNTGSTLSDAIFRHPDLSPVAAIGVFLHFAQPLARQIDSLSNITAIIPAATAVGRFREYEIQRFCVKNGRADMSEACVSARKWAAISRVVIENAVKLANNGQQAMQYEQWSAEHTQRTRRRES